MGQVIVDNIDLLEPNLRIPGKKPVGNVTAKDGWSAWMMGGLRSHGVGKTNRVLTSFNSTNARNDLVLNGTSSYASLDNSDDFFTGSKFSFIVDIVSGGTQVNDARLLDCKTVWNGTDGWSLTASRLTNSVQVLLSGGGSSPNIDIGTGLWQDGARVILVGVLDGNKIQIYRSGVYKGESYSGGVTANTNNLMLGRYFAASGNYLKGTVKMFAFKQAQISGAKAAALSADPYSILEPGLGAGLRFIGAKSLAGPTLFMSAYGA